jgi:hypothetical protein
MKSYHEETLSALFDGEAAAPDALADALAQPDAAEFLVRLSRLRGLTRDDDRRPDDQFYAAMKRVFRPHRWYGWLSRAVPLPAAAAAVAVAVAATLALPLLAPRSSLPPPPPPAVLGVAVVTGAPALPSIAPEAGTVRLSLRPPLPDRVMLFVDGRDWRQGL